MRASLRAMLVKIPVAMAIALVASGAARSSLASDEIVYRVRFNSVICTGVCPNFELRVRPDGQVRERIFHYDGSVREDIFNVSVRAVRDFRRELEPVRPTVSRQFGAPCDARSDPSSTMPGVSNYVVTWPGVQLRACFGELPVARATSRALLQLRIRPSDGHRISAADARTQYACWKDTEDGYC